VPNRQRLKEKGEGGSCVATPAFGWGEGEGLKRGLFSRFLSF